MYGEVFVIAGIGMMVSSLVVLIGTIHYAFDRKETLSKKLLDDYGSIICGRFPQQK